ncbi:MAG: endonuclease/exonuclease/phosphatase family protein [Candidatus Sphingomonas phytovorans]|nr:endonuclease/exonuclease/phosphatase family protein [Sphingomonas sp.]WEK00776.1 MAG: endonuclease/exonuclease/phosphatase family protein [Sphingomonas sp.]
MIKVASYNIHKGIGLDRRRDPNRILDVLREIDADIIALQEADRRFGAKAGVIPLHALEEHSPWKAVPFGARAGSMGWHGNVLLIRKDSVVIDCEPIHLPALEPRGAVMADVRADGVPIRIVGMHLDLSGLWRRRQAHAILTHVDSSTTRRPTVLMGDLNEWSAQAGCLRDFGHAYSFATTGPSFHVRRPVARLDRIMVSSDLRVADCGVHHSATARKASDHFPIWAMIEAK